MSHLRLRRCLPLAAVLVLPAAIAWGQEFRLPSPEQFRGLQPAAGSVDGEKSTVSVKAVFTAPAEGQPARLYVTAEIKKGWHIYSITQPKGGPIGTRIKLPESAAYRVAGDFKSAPPPEVHRYPEAYKDLPVEEHAGRVTWHAPIELAAGTDPATLKIEGKLNVQACDAANCLPPHDYPFTAVLGAAPQLSEPAKAPKSAVYQNPRSHSQITGEVNVNTAVPGQTVQLSLTATPAEQWHVYALAEKASAAGSKPTLIVLTDLPAGWTASVPKTASPAISKQDGPSGFVQPHHEGPVTWTIDILIPADARPGEHQLGGLMGYQTCWDGGCDLPLATRFEVPIRVAEQPVAGGTLVTFVDAKYGEAAQEAGSQTGADAAASPAAPSGFDPAQLKTNSAGDSSSASMPLMMLFGFLGGLILNLMPCVLPVIGLKILSFVEQSGQDRKRVLWLNIWYSLGLMSVFMVLAALAAFLGFGWGQQFTSSTFNIVLTGVVFAMALSFLGVWEIPIPGLVGSGKANDLAAREGVGGAFAKGMITTVLATPCTGPFLGTALAWSVRQPPYLIMLFYACVGLGMASPYLVLGAFPSLVRFLPKPGAWMETFKQLMGFVLLGTVIFLLTFINVPLVVPTVALMFGIWLACWWIGRTSFTADLGVKVRAWMAAVTIVALSGLLAFNWPEEEHRLPWQPFNRQALDDLAGQHQTVLVDFTADWCLICKTLEKTVLNTEPVKGVVDTNRVVPLLADWTDGNEEVTAMLELLGSKQVPVLAIFPAGRPNQPIVFRDPYTQQQLIDALQKAGPSQSKTDNATAMVP